MRMTMKRQFFIGLSVALSGCTPKQKYLEEEISLSEQEYKEKIVQCFEEQLQEKDNEKAVEYTPLKNFLTIQVKYDKEWRKEHEVKNGIYCDTVTSENSKICYVQGNNPFSITDDTLLFWSAKSVDIPIATHIDLIIDQGVDGKVDKVVSGISFAEANAYLARKNDPLPLSTVKSAQENGYQTLYSGTLKYYYEARIVNGGRIIDKYPTFLHQCPETIVGIWNENNKNTKQ